MSVGYPLAPVFIEDDKLHRIRLAETLNRTIGGKLNAVGTITLRASNTTTELIDARIGYASFIELMPTTAHAATAKAGVWFSGAKSGSITINHASSANVDQTFIYLIIG